jgi:signal transduction histidine kinase
LERERDQQALIAAAEERTRIAREMHDVVAHSLSVMVTLSEGAARKQAVDPPRAAEAIRQVSATGREALDEMRRLLGVLRTESKPAAGNELAAGSEPAAEGGTGERRPQPGVAQLGRLLDQVRVTGLAVTSVLTVTPEDMSPGAELTVYRIVQEALTNTLKHAAGPAEVRIAIARRLGEVIVDVHDDGAARPGRPRDGHGLTGMSERAAVYGGTVSAGFDPAGGWRVQARLPIAEPPRAEGARPPAESMIPAGRFR